MPSVIFLPRVLSVNVLVCLLVKSTLLISNSKRPECLVCSLRLYERNCKEYIASITSYGPLFSFTYTVFWVISVWNNESYLYSINDKRKFQSNKMYVVQVCRQAGAVVIQVDGMQIKLLAATSFSHNVRKRAVAHARPAKILISLRIRADWSESSLGAIWIAKDAKFLHADNEDSNQTARMRRLIWVFVGRTWQKVRFLNLRFIQSYRRGRSMKTNFSIRQRLSILSSGDSNVNTIHIYM